MFFILGLLLLAGTAAAQTPQAAPARRVLAGHRVPRTAQLTALGDLPGTNQLTLRLGLPLRNQAELDQLLREQQDPASPNYRQWLTPEQFTARFGPTEEDYQKVVQFAAQNGLHVSRTQADRLMVSVDAPVAAIEKTFSLKLRRFTHPSDNRTFYAPDADPAVDASVPLLHVAGLDDYEPPHRLGGALQVTPLGATNDVVRYATGSAPGGLFMGNDFRAAYVPGVTNTGAGQYIAIINVGGPYYPMDVYYYQIAAGLSTNIPLTNIVTTFTPYWTNALTGSNVDAGEQVLDITMAMSMAPGAVILDYEGEAHDVFSRIASDNLAKQMTLSYGFGIDAIIQQYFQQFVAQGQSMSQASGDGGADPAGGTGLTGAPYSTIVGGVSLTTSGAGGPWQSETAWGGSGGGISGYGIPNWQQGINMTANQGSVSYRNYPDVSMPADNIYIILKNGTSRGGVGGTSCSSPLWAGFMALVNQQAAAQGKPPVGFANPAIYAIGTGKMTYNNYPYANCFHDTTTGNTYNNHSPTRFAATTGYDLCTGWGSPRGSSVISALAGIATPNPDFTFYPSQATFNLVAGASASGNVVLTRMNGLTGSATFSITGLPAGITATISPATTSGTAALSITTATNLLPGNYPATLTGTMGSLTHSVALNFVISDPIPGALPVTLPYNRIGFYTDGRIFGGSAGADGSYAAYSANLIGSNLSWNGLVFNLGPANASDVTYCSGQTINLPAGNFNTLQLLATGVQGNQSAQTFTVTYTDNTTATFTQSLSDWCNPQSYSGESVALAMPYRNLNTGGAESITVRVYGYTFVLDQTKTVKSIILPNNRNVVLLSAVLANNQVSAPLAGYYNHVGIYTDKTTYTNPATGGLDGGGASLSGTLLGGSLTWSNTIFNFGPMNATNVISCINQTIPLPPGNCTQLRLLATAVQGSQPAQSFMVTYTDNTTATFSQGVSDWYTPANYTGESKAFIFGHRNSSDGTTDNRTFYLYGYTFTLNSAKTVKSIRLPNNANVMVAAISLIPNWQPTFRVNPIQLAAASAGQFYSVSIATNYSDLNGGALTCAKVSGPAWLNVAANGTLSGTPLSADVGNNTLAVSVTDPGGLSCTATVNLTVTPAPPIISAITAQPGGALLLNWTGGLGPFQVQSTTNLANPVWVTAGDGVTGHSWSIVPTNEVMFYRLVGQ